MVDQAVKNGCCHGAVLMISATGYYQRLTERYHTLTPSLPCKDDLIIKSDTRLPLECPNCFKGYLITNKAEWVLQASLYIDRGEREWRVVSAKLN